jgi:hypothetical protein
VTKCIASYCIVYTSSRAEFELTTLLVIGTDWIGRYKSNYHPIFPKTRQYGEGKRYYHRMFCTENEIANIIFDMKNMSWKYHS